MNNSTCQQCHNTLKISDSNLLGITCPRCNFWNELKTDCDNSCNSCYKKAINTDKHCQDSHKNNNESQNILLKIVQFFK